MRNAAAAQSPVNTSGVQKTSVAVRAPLPKNAALKSLSYVESGSCPVRSRTKPMSTSATPIEPIGTAIVSQRGWSSRRSNLMAPRPP